MYNRDPVRDLGSHYTLIVPAWELGGGMMIQDRGRFASPSAAGRAPPRSGAQGAGICDRWTPAIYFYLISRSVSGFFIQEGHTCKSQKHSA